MNSSTYSLCVERFKKAERKWNRSLLYDNEEFDYLSQMTVKEEDIYYIDPSTGFKDVFRSIILKEKTDLMTDLLKFNAWDSVLDFSIDEDSISSHLARLVQQKDI